MEWNTVETIIPDSVKGIPLEMGIDEAGRGPVLGPMVYCGAVAPVGYKFPKEIDDSKKLTSEERESDFELLKTFPVGFAVRVIPAVEISAKQLARNPINLNAQSHAAAVSLVDSMLNAGLQVERLYVDTVGKAETYEEYLQSRFPSIKVTVSAKADAKYKIVGAASICAKVRRDHLLEDFKFEEPCECSREFGSGYPSDPGAKAWLEENFAPVFGYPSIVRFSWATIDAIFDSKKETAIFEYDEQPALPDSPFFATRHLRQFAHN